MRTLYIWFLSSFKNLGDHLLIKTNDKIWLNGLRFCALGEKLAAKAGQAIHFGVTVSSVTTWRD